MKFIWFVLVALALFAMALLFSVARPAALDAVPPTQTTAPADTPTAGHAALPEPRVITPNAADGAERMLQQMEKLMSRLERLESTVREVRTEISIRSDERSRVAVSNAPSSGPSRLDETDKDTLRALIREGLINEAWKRRQEELVGIGRHFALSLQLESRFVAPMIEVLCVDSLPLFNLERDLADHNYDAGLARRSQAEFKAARRRLRADLGETLRNEDLAARVFVHVVSEGEVAALELGRDRLLAVEKDWLR